MLGHANFLPPVMGPAPDFAVPYQFMDEFYSISVGAADAETWLETGNASGINGDIVDDLRGGVAAMKTGTTGGHTVQWQLNGSHLLPAANREIIWMGRFKIDDVSAGETSYGLTEESVTDQIDDAIKEGISFYTNASGELYWNVGNATVESEASTGVTVADVEWFDLAFHVKGTNSVDFYVNGTLVHAFRDIPETYMPLTNHLTAFMAVKSTSTTAEELYVDRVGFADYDS